MISFFSAADDSGAAVGASVGSGAVVGAWVGAGVAVAQPATRASTISRTIDVQSIRLFIVYVQLVRYMSCLGVVGRRSGVVSSPPFRVPAPEGSRGKRYEARLISPRISFPNTGGDAVSSDTLSASRHSQAISRVEMVSFRPRGSETQVVKLSQFVPFVPAQI
jgi:hypothetical protein